MTVPLKLTIPNRIAFNVTLISGILTSSTGRRVNLTRPVILNDDNHAELTFDKGKNYY